jgi:molecular chaperone DnaK
MRATVDYGIDLGTSNSAIAVMDGPRPRLLTGPDGGTLLPSAVRITRDGTVEVGAGAYAARGKDPANTAVEFKRQMGGGHRVAFPASGRSHTPIELSAMVLRALADRAEAAEGGCLRAAVITVPAMFQLSQCEATRQAAARVGIDHAPLLQEPIAAAIAQAGSGYAREGYWLVYDLGGGTFDVSLVRSRGGRLLVLDHDGDNHLGGKDFNWLLAKFAADLIRHDGELGEFRRTDPKHAEAFARLTAEAERVRIRLSEVEQEPFVVHDLGTGPNGQPVGLNVAVDRELLETMIAPAVLRTTRMCTTLLDKNRLTAANLNAIVLVGGPTRTPCLPAILEREIGLPASHLMDPTTIVACGAALFAATQKIPATVRPDDSGVDLEYESMTTNLRPLVVGKVRTPDGPAGLSVRIRRDDGQFESGPFAVNPQGAFSSPLALRNGELNVFDLALTRGDAPARVGPIRFAILHGLSVAKPPLSQSVGVMLADNSVRWYLRKGQVLPASNTVTQMTTARLARGQSGEAIRVPLVQGESERADRNQVIGVLSIRSGGIARDLPAGTEVEVTLSVDEFSRTTARAYVPLIDQWFDEVVRLEAQTKDAAEVATGLAAQLDRLRQLELEADSLADAGGDDQDPRIAEIEARLAEGDRDSIEVADHLVRMMSGQIDRAEVGARAEKLRADFASQFELGDAILEDGPPREELASLADEFQAALDSCDLETAEAKYVTTRNLVLDARLQTLAFWEGILDWLQGRFEALGMLGVVGQQLQEGSEAAGGKDFGRLVHICNDLLDRLPREDRQEYEAVVSNVM